MMRKVILFLAIVCCATAAIDNCKQSGDYCLNHWDCCSNTCLSYLYKCSRIQNKQPPPAALGAAQMSPPLFAPPAIPNINHNLESINSLIEIVFRPLKGVPVPTSGRDVNAILSRLGEDEPEQELVETTTFDPVYSTPIDRAYANTIEPTTDAPCKEIGSKCYTNDECCTARCHGFLHQCVT